MDAIQDHISPVTCSCYRCVFSALCGESGSIHLIQATFSPKFSIFTLFMAKNWEPGLAVITGPEDWDRAIVHLWGESVNEFKRAFPHLLKSSSPPKKTEARLYDFPKPPSDASQSAVA